MSTEALVFDAVRTPRGRGRPGGSLNSMSPGELGAGVLSALRDRNSLGNAEIEDVIFGCVEPVDDQGGNIARTSLLLAAYSDSVPGLQLNRFCGSGLEAVNIVSAKLMAGQIELAIAGGVEMMSLVPFASAGGPYTSDPEFLRITDLVPQGISADIIASRYGYSRSDVDAYAVASQRRAKQAWERGAFDRSVVPVVHKRGRFLLSRDEHMRPDATIESLASLKPAFADAGEIGFDSIALQRYPDIKSINHVHHAGNSSGIVDGAAAVLIGNRKMADHLGVKPRARIRAFAAIGSDPCIMLDGTGAAARKALKLAGMEVGDVDLFEVNEAFAAVVLRFMDELNVPHDKVNVNGGSIAMGHPLGATGAMLVGVAVDELEARGVETAMVAICVGVGMAVATIVERV